jgi:hypothetical protein
MFNIINKLFKTNCNKYYKEDMYKYLNCVNSKIFKITDYNKKIYVIHSNIDEYIDLSEIFMLHDYNEYIKYDTYTYKKIKKHIYIKNFYITSNGVYKDKEILLKKLINNTIKLIEIYQMLQITKNRINLFNSNILKQYIINVVDIVNISINQN